MPLQAAFGALGNRARWLRWLLVALFITVLSLSVPGTVLAQGLESVLSPGKLIKGHEKAEAECSNCHRKFDREAQDVLCGECHKDVRADLREKKGFHGRQKPQACRSCHTDHKGRDAKIVNLDTKSFDHKLTDYLLSGKHAATECKACHTTGKKWREAASDCNSCHKKDDVHKAALGVKCQDCHNDTDWKKTSFDHAKTRFALTLKHADVKCSGCHKDQRYQDAPRTCIGCHKKDDDQVIQGRRGHQGQFGEKCETCHDAKAWKPSTFSHDRDTSYALKGKHRATDCKSCHTGTLYKQKLGSDCLSCHKKDDKHEGTLGTKCADCHNERGWKDQGKFDHDKTSFPLLGKHLEAKCESCHKSTVFKDAPKDCLACHLKEDKHEGNLGKACGDCHTERDWKTTKGRFDHDKTKFPLVHGHASAKVECKSCHRDLKSMRNTPLACYSCHEKDDKHQGQQGKQCESCHTDRDWTTTTTFDHAKSRFPLTGKHIVTACKDCHTTPRFKDAPRDCMSCHKKDDKHKLTLGTACESCHNARAWSLWTFDHDKTDYKLEASHRKVTCNGCHTQAAPVGKVIAAVGKSCLSCHRKDDVHDGGFGNRCEQCHSADKWKKISNRTMRTSSVSPDTRLGIDDPLFVGNGETLGFASHVSRRYRKASLDEARRTPVVKASQQPDKQDLMVFDHDGLVPGHPADAAGTTWRPGAIAGQRQNV